MQAISSGGYYSLFLAKNSSAYFSGGDGYGTVKDSFGEAAQNATAIFGRYIFLQNGSVMKCQVEYPNVDFDCTPEYLPSTRVAKTVQLVYRNYFWSKFGGRANLNFSDVKEIKTDRNWNTAMIVTNNNTLFVLGWYIKNLGDRTRDMSYTRMPVEIMSDVKAVAVDYGYCLIVKNDDSMYLRGALGWSKYMST